MSARGDAVRAELCRRIRGLEAERDAARAEAARLDIVAAGLAAKLDRARAIADRAVPRVRLIEVRRALAVES